MIWLTHREQSENREANQESQEILDELFLRLITRDYLDLLSKNAITYTNIEIFRNLYLFSIVQIKGAQYDFITLRQFIVIFMSKKYNITAIIIV